MSYNLLKGTTFRPIAMLLSRLPLPPGMGIKQKNGVENYPVYQLNLLKLFVMKKYQTQKYRAIGQAHVMDDMQLTDSRQFFNTSPMPAVHL
jgi:hypothetical protein